MQKRKLPWIRSGLRSRQQRGVAAVEFALVLLPMLLIAFGVVEYGRAVYQYNTLVKSVRSAARVLSWSNPNAAAYRTVEVVRAKCLAVFGTDDCSGIPLSPTLSLLNVQVCDRISWVECPGASEAMFKQVNAGGAEIDLVAVRISGYQHQFLGLPLVTSSPVTTFADIESVMRQGNE